VTEVAGRTGPAADGRLFPDDTVAEVAEATEFYTDLEGWLAEAESLPGGRRYRSAIDEVPSVPGAAALPRPW
jgi:hypothetical protein